MTTTTPMKKAAPAAAGKPPAAPSGSVSALVKSLDTVQISDQYELYEFLEAYRAIGHRIGVEMLMVAHNVEAGLKAQAKKDATFGIVGFNSHMAIRRFSKQMKAAGEHMASGSGAAAVAWRLFQADFDEALSRKKPVAKASKGFSIDM
jgi:hypothetical protein